MKNKLIYFGLALVVGVILGHMFWPKHVSYTATGVSTAGATNSTAKEYTVQMTPATTAATTTSLLNGDGTDRVIISSTAYCTSVGTSQTFLTGAGLTSFTLQMSTSTTGSLGLQGNVNFASNLTISTSSPWSYTGASTTEAVTPSGRVWPTGTYLNMTFNATNTAACTVGVRTLSL